MAGLPSQDDSKKIPNRFLFATNSASDMIRAVMSMEDLRKSFLDLKSELDSFFQTFSMGLNISSEPSGIQYLRVYHALVCCGASDSRINSSNPVETQQKWQSVIREKLFVLLLKKLNEKHSRNFKLLELPMIANQRRFAPFMKRSELVQHAALVTNVSRFYCQSDIKYLAYQIHSHLFEQPHANNPLLKSYRDILKSFLEDYSPAQLSRADAISGAAFGSGAAAEAASAGRQVVPAQPLSAFAFALDPFRGVTASGSVEIAFVRSHQT